MEAVEPEVYRGPLSIRHIEDVDRSGHWLRQGWDDFLATPWISLIYGGAFALVSLALTVGLFSSGLSSLILPLAGGFVIMAPVFVVGLYDVSRRREMGLDVSLSDVLATFAAHASQLSAIGIVLMLCFWIWVETALVLFMGIFNAAPPPLETFITDVVFSANGAVLLIVGSMFGAVFGAIIFSITAVSVPLIFDQPIDVVTAITTSMRAVRDNWRLMFGWAALIVLVIGCGMITAFLGLAVALPVLAYATWHCYRDVIDTGAAAPPG